MFLRAMFRSCLGVGHRWIDRQLYIVVERPRSLCDHRTDVYGTLGPLSVFAAVSRTAKETKVLFAKEEPLVG